MPIDNKILDRRVRLSEEDRVRLIELKEQLSQREAARMFSISRRSVQFIWYPEKLEENKLRRKERGGWKQYQDKEKQNLAMKKHRDYKKQLLKEGLL
ncbi:MAG: hypothetical protein ACJAVA_000262 [Flavobacteriaceae bacterium]|jgi:hypothetical protein